MMAARTVRGSAMGLVGGGLAVCSLMMAASGAHAETPVPASFPLVIFCEAAGVTHAFYFSRIGADGAAVYLTPDGLAGAITVDGVAYTVSGTEPGNCADKTLEELRAQGQAFFLPR